MPGLAPRLATRPAARNRLVMFSNRLVDSDELAACGLAAMLGDLTARAHGLWFGWIGPTRDEAEAGRNRTRALRG